MRILWIGNKTRIKILRETKSCLGSPFEGLCHTLGMCTCEFYYNSFFRIFCNIRIPDLTILFPDFTYENAKLFGAYTDNREWAFWWPITEEGYSKRQEFLDWMIQELSKKKDPFWKRLIILHDEKS